MPKPTPSLPPMSKIEKGWEFVLRIHVFCGLYCYSKQTWCFGIVKFDFFFLNSKYMFFVFSISFSFFLISTNGIQPINAQVSFSLIIILFVILQLNISRKKLLTNPFSSILSGFPCRKKACPVEKHTVQVEYF